MAFPQQGLDFPGVGSLKNAFHPPQSHTQNPFQVKTELQFPFFISQRILFQSVPMLPARPQSPKPSSSRWTCSGFSLPPRSLLHHCCPCYCASGPASHFTIDTPTLKSPPLSPPVSTPHAQATPFSLQPPVPQPCHCHDSPNLSGCCDPGCTYLGEDKDHGAYICALVPWNSR